MRILLDYDEKSGALTDLNGVCPASFIGLIGFKKNESTIIESLVKLKNAGYTADEIVMLKNKDVF